MKRRLVDMKNNCDNAQQCWMECLENKKIFQLFIYFIHTTAKRFKYIDHITTDSIIKKIVESIIMIWFMGQNMQNEELILEFHIIESSQSIQLHRYFTSICRWYVQWKILLHPHPNNLRTSLEFVARLHNFHNRW